MLVNILMCPCCREDFVSEGNTWVKNLLNFHCKCLEEREYFLNFCPFGKSVPLFETIQRQIELAVIVLLYSQQNYVSSVPLLDTFLILTDDDRSDGDRDSVRMIQRDLGENCYMTG